MASPELDRAIAMFRADKAETQTFQVGIFRAEPECRTRELPGRTRVIPIFDSMAI